MEIYVHIIEAVLTIAIVADFLLGHLVHKRQVLAKPLYLSTSKNQILKALGFRSFVYLLMIWALNDRSIEASDTGYISVCYIGVVLKGLYDVKYNSAARTSLDAN